MEQTPEPSWGIFLTVCLWHHYLNTGQLEFLILRGLSWTTLTGEDGKDNKISDVAKFWRGPISKAKNYVH